MDETEDFVAEFTFTREITLDDVHRCYKALHRLLRATHRHISGDPKADFPLKLTNMDFKDDGNHVLRITIAVPKASPSP